MAVLMTVHNRRNTTLCCLERLFAQQLPDGIAYVVFLVDDGSSDGTAEAVRKNFPQARTMPGDGNLYWNQGMRLAWGSAAEADDWDAYLWLNDDTMLLDRALSTMLETLEAQRQETGKRGIVVGSCRAPILDDGDEVKVDRVEPSLGGEGPSRSETANNPQPSTTNHQPTLTYGGRNERGLIQPAAHPQPIKAFNGNLVLVSREAFELLGNLSGEYRHSFGDIDYGIRAVQAGLPVWLAPGFQAVCSKSSPPAWCDPRVPLIMRFRSLQGPKGLVLRERWHFHSLPGTVSFFLEVLKIVLKVFFPGWVGGGRNRDQRQCE